MEPTDRTPEERMGTAGRIRKRVDELLALADACVAEAGEQETSARRLRERAELLREKAAQYRVAARAAEQAEEGMEEAIEVMLRAPVIAFERPEHPQSGDVVLEQDPVDPSVYRRWEFSEEHGWKRMGPVNT